MGKMMTNEMIKSKGLFTTQQLFVIKNDSSNGEKTV